MEEKPLPKKPLSIETKAILWFTITFQWYCFMNLNKPVTDFTGAPMYGHGAYNDIPLKAFAIAAIVGILFALYQSNKMSKYNEKIKSLGVEVKAQPKYLRITKIIILSFLLLTVVLISIACTKW